MRQLTNEQRQEILDWFGQKVIEHVRDISLKIAMDIVNGNTNNKIKREQYALILDLSLDEKDKVSDLLSETITDTIYNFLDMFEAFSEEIRINVTYNSGEYDLNTITEKMGGEIAFKDKDGWIQKFSKIGRFII